MQEESQEFSDNEKLMEEVKRFQKMIKNNHFEYFDVSETEEIADYFLDCGKIILAKKAVDNGLDIHPSATALQIRKAKLLLLDKKTEECLKIIQNIEDMESTNSDIYLIKGCALISRQDKIKEAIEAFEKAILYNKENTDELLYEISMTLIQIKEEDKASEFLHRAFKINPENEQVIYEIAFLCEKHKKYEKSIYYYNLCLDVNPFNAPIWYNIGINYSALKNEEKALESYDFAIALADDFEEAYFNKANILSNSNNFEEAISCYKDFISINGNNDDAFCYLAECYLHLNKPNDAFLNYLEALKINNKNFNAWYG
ncbi:MAG: hypothetical protein JJE45_04040, partial [Prolixibacteraceae bacterium]|nr:hypothetical protein [Prolixibacteraceae bacterium]